MLWQSIALFLGIESANEQKKHRRFSLNVVSIEWIRLSKEVTTTTVFFTVVETFHFTFTRSEITISCEIMDFNY